MNNSNKAACIAPASILTSTPKTHTVFAVELLDNVEAFKGKLFEDNGKTFTVKDAFKSNEKFDGMLYTITVVTEEGTGFTLSPNSLLYLFEIHFDAEDDAYLEHQDDNYLDQYQD